MPEVRLIRRGGNINIADGDRIGNYFSGRVARPEVRRARLRVGGRGDFAMGSEVEA